LECQKEKSSVLAAAAAVVVAVEDLRKRKRRKKRRKKISHQNPKQRRLPLQGLMLSVPVHSVAVSIQQAWLAWEAWGDR